MKLEEFERVSKKFYEDSKDINNEFNKLFAKWLKKSPKVTMLNLLNLPLNTMLNLMSSTNINFYELLPDLPNAYIRMIAPFIKLKDEYGKISNKEFCDKYVELYESQFEKFFNNEEEKEAFKKFMGHE